MERKIIKVAVKTKLGEENRILLAGSQEVTRNG